MRLVYKCQFNRLHRIPTEVETCPGCLQTLPRPTRQRRNAVVAHMFSEGTGGDDFAASNAPSSSWETVYSATPGSEHDPNTTETSQNPEEAYPTPPRSRDNSAGEPDQIPGSPSEESRSPPTFTFTSNTHTTSRDPSFPRQEICSQLANETYRKLRTPTHSRTDSDGANTPLPAPPPTPPMAPTKPTNRVKRRTRSATSSAAAAAAAGAGAGAASTTQVPETPLVETANAATQSITPSIEPITEEEVEAAVEHSTTPPPSPPHLAANDPFVTHLRTRNNDLTSQLRDSTALVQRLRTRSEITTLEKERAYVDRDAALAETEAVRAERDAQKGRIVGVVVKLRAVMMLAVLYAVYRFVLFGPEFEYVMRRAREELGVEWWDL